MSGYENAPATRLLATRCAICARPLVDANSIEAGIGPDCRAKYGYDDPVGADERREANSLVYRLALRRSELANAPDAEASVAALVRIRSLGLSRLADTLEERLCEIQLEAVEDRGRERLALTSPYRVSFVDDLRLLKRSDGFELERRWDSTTARWLFPPDDEARALLWRVLKVHFKEGIGRGPKGPFPIKPRAMNSSSKTVPLQGSLFGASSEEPLSSSTATRPEGRKPHREHEVRPSRRVGK